MLSKSDFSGHSHYTNKADDWPPKFRKGRTWAIAVRMGFVSLFLFSPEFGPLLRITMGKFGPKGRQQKGETGHIFADFR